LAVRKYELMVILDPTRTEEQQKETLDKIDETITKYGGTPDRRDVWGKRRLAYQINRRRDGYYAVVYFDTVSTNEVLAEVERFCKYSEEVMRHIVTLAVVGKSAGNPALDREREERQARLAAQQAASRGYDRRPRRTEEAPVAAAPAAEEAPAPAVAEAEAEGTPSA